MVKLSEIDVRHERRERVEDVINDRGIRDMSQYSPLTQVWAGNHLQMLCSHEAPYCGQI